MSTTTHTRSPEDVAFIRENLPEGIRDIYDEAVSRGVTDIVLGPVGGFRFVAAEKSLTRERPKAEAKKLSTAEVWAKQFPGRAVVNRPSTYSVWAKQFPIKLSGQ